MYSWEIDNFLRYKNHMLTSDEYKQIITSSPQIRFIEYQPSSDDFVINTDDNYHWRFKVYRKDK